MRQVLTESTLLAGLGGAVGFGLAFLIRNQLLPLLNQDEAPIDITLRLGPRLAAFSIGVCLVVAVTCGILPALRATRLGLSGMLKRTAAGGHVGSSRLFAGKTLIALQVALSLVLVVGAALFTRTLVNLRSQALGFRADHLLLVGLDATAAGYKDGLLLDFYERVLERVGALPAVRTASLSRYGLLSGGATRDTIIVPDAPGGPKEIRAHVHYVSPGYLETMGIPLIAGRELTARDREAAPRVAFVNQALARLLPGDGAPIGRRILYDRPDADLEIVGIAADARFATLRESIPPTLYLPYRQYRQHDVTLAVRVDGDPTSFIASIRRAVDGIDPAVPLIDVRTQEAQIDAAVRQERLFAYAAGGFAALALLLACLGIYGTLTYSVARRTSEIGLRMALGADRWSVASMVMRESLLPVLIGALIGLGTALATTGFVQGMLFGLTPHDVPTLVFASLALILTALWAAWLPCRRASGVDPMTALRSE
jgi:predicted permease